MINRILSVLPKFPRKIYGVYTGTNTFQEFLLVLKSLLSTDYQNLDVIQKYEQSFSNYIGVDHCYSFGAGRMALYAILEALNLTEGDEVLIPAFTCVVVPNAFIYKNITPVYVDINLETFNIDINLIEEKITKNTKAIYAQHTFGVPCDLIRINEIARKFNLYVIEDCGHSLGGKLKDKYLGTLSDVAFFTTDHSKTINTHLGGLAVSNNKKIAASLGAIQEKTSFLSTFTIKRLAVSFLFEFIYYNPWFLWLGRTIHPVLRKIGITFYFDDELSLNKPDKYPYPCRLSSLQAKIGMSQLENIETNIKHRNKITAYLNSKIKYYDNSKIDFNNISCLRYSFLVNDRSQFEKVFSSKFDLSVWFTSIFAGRNKDFHLLNYTNGDCPNAEFAARHIVNFPTHQKISILDLKKNVGNKIEFIMSSIYRY